MELIKESVLISRLVDMLLLWSVCHWGGGCEFLVPVQCIKYRRRNKRDSFCRSMGGGVQDACVV